MTEEILAFSAHQVSRLTDLSLGQLRYWDRTHFFSPEYASGYRRGAFTRVYSFRDLVGLYTISVFRKEHRFTLQELRRVAGYLHRFHTTPWSALAFYLSSRDVFFRDPDNPDSFVGARPLSQAPMSILEMERIVNEVAEKARKLRQRGNREVGRVERNRYVVHNAHVLAGTRVPTRAVWNLHRAGYDTSEIIREFPRLKGVDVQAAINFESRRRRTTG